MSQLNQTSLSWQARVQPSATRRPPASSENASSYLDAYLGDPVLLAALYEGNAIDCDLYDAAATRLDADLADLRRDRPALYVGAGPTPRSAPCARGKRALAAWYEKNADALYETQGHRGRGQPPPGRPAPCGAACHGSHGARSGQRPR